MERKEEVLEYDSSIEGKMEVVIDVSFTDRQKSASYNEQKGWRDYMGIWGHDGRAWIRAAKVLCLSGC